VNNKTGNHHSTAGHDTIATNHQGKINKVFYGGYALSRFKRLEWLFFLEIMY